MAEVNNQENNEEKEEEYQFPIKRAAVCPTCGSSKRFIQGYIGKRKAEGKFHQDSFPLEAGAIELQFIDPQHLPLTAVFEMLGLQIALELCECGAMYWIRVDETKQMAQTSVMGPDGKPGGQLPAGFGRG